MVPLFIRLCRRFRRTALSPRTAGVNCGSISGNPPEETKISASSAKPPGKQTVSPEHPNRRRRRNIRPERQTTRPLLFLQDNEQQADDGADDRAEHQRKQGRLPAEEGADGSHK